MNPSPLTDAAALLPAIVQSADDAIVTKDLGGTITSWNHAAERMFGYTAEEAVGRSIRLIIAPDRYSEEDAVLDRIRRGDSVDHYETVRVRRDGALIAVSLTVSPVRSVTGEIIGASKIARDITDRRRADMALTEAQATGADLQRRLLALVAASGSLLGSPHLSDVLPAILRLARELVAADGYAVWRLDLVSKAWSIRSYSGISEDFASAVIKSYGGEPVSTWTFTEPLSSEDVETAPLLDERREAYRQEGIRSMLAIPLTVHGQTSGTLVFYYRARHCFSDVEVQTRERLAIWQPLR